jgi:hypothetical protein
LGVQQLQTENLFTDESTFNGDGMTNTWNSHVWSLDDPHASTETHSLSRFSVNVWCGVIGSQVMGPSELEERLTSESYLRFLEDELLMLLDDVPLHIRRELCLQQDGATNHFGRQVTEILLN